jgi:CubicO group peptidase (beta-lactamase class C family)
LRPSLRSTSFCIASQQIEASSGRDFERYPAYAENDQGAVVGLGVSKARALELCKHSSSAAWAGSRPEADPMPVPDPDGWRVAAPEDVGLDGAVLGATGERFTAFTEANLHSLLVVRRGSLVYERYFVGEDQAWADQLGRVSFDASTKHDVRSITKSVTALLVGIAIERQLISGIEELVFTYFPHCADLRTPQKDGIRLRHLLTMSPGFDWDEYRPFSDPHNSEARMYRSPDPYRFVLQQPLVTPPGKFFRYNSGATELLGGVLHRTTNRRLDDFAREVLFEPLGIADTAWNGFSNGIPAASAGLRLRPRDMAKLGQLVLNRGQWNGRQIIPETWIRDSSLPQIGRPDGIYFYGYQWWLGRSLVDKREVPWVAAMGRGGQHIFVVPRLDLVVVLTAGLYDNPALAWVAVDTLNRYVLAAVRN